MYKNIVLCCTSYTHKWLKTVRKMSVLVHIMTHFGSNDSFEVFCVPASPWSGFFLRVGEMSWHIYMVSFSLKNHTDFKKELSKLTSRGRLQRESLKVTLTIPERPTSTIWKIAALLQMGSRSVSAAEWLVGENSSSFHLIVHRGNLSSFNIGPYCPHLHGMCLFC